MTFKVRIDQPNFSATALAKLSGSGSWSQTYIATPGETVTVSATYRNIGTTQQDDVILRVNLPQNVHYVDGTTTWSKASARDQLASNGIAGRGISIDSFDPGDSGTATFDVMVDAPLEKRPTTQAIDEFLVVETNAGSKTAPLSFVWLE